MAEYLLKERIIHVSLVIEKCTTEIYCISSSSALVVINGHSLCAMTYATINYSCLGNIWVLRFSSVWHDFLYAMFYLLAHPFVFSSKTALTAEVRQQKVQRDSRRKKRESCIWGAWKVPYRRKALKMQFWWEKQWQEPSKLINPLHPTSISIIRNVKFWLACTGWAI